MENNLNVFFGPDAVEHFSTRPAFGAAVELLDELNPLKNKGVVIVAISAPEETLKEAPAINMLRGASDAGLLDEHDTIVVPTSGNFGKCVLKHAKRFGIKRVVMVVLSDLAPKKLEMLNFLGAEVISVPSGTIARAAEEAKKNGWFCLNQYQDDNNWRAHKQHLGPQIWKQTDGKVSLFASAMGTCGTVIGVGKFLKKENPQVKVLGVNLLRGEEVPGVRDLERIRKDVTLPWEDSIDNVDQPIEVGANASFLASLQLCRVAKLKAGPSAGTGYCGLLTYLLCEDKNGRLDLLRNHYGKVVAVFPCHDGPEQYLEKYLTRLPASVLQY